MQTFLCAFVIAVLLVSACTTASEIPAPTDAQPDTSAPEPDDVSETAGKQDADDWVSPIFDAIGFDPDDVPRLEAERSAKVNAAIATCMRERGFEYKVIAAVTDQSQQAVWAAQENLTISEFAQTYGYGIATLAHLDYEGQGALAAVSGILGTPADAERTAKEQDAFELALNGYTLDTVSDTTDLGGDLEPAEGSCRAEALASSSGSIVPSADRMGELLGDDLATLDERFLADPRVIATNKDWQTCMAAAGHSFETPDDIIAELREATAALTDALLNHPTTLDLLEQAVDQGLAQMTLEGRKSLLTDLRALDGFARVPKLQAELDQLADRERMLATTSLGCSDIDTFLRVRAELEMEFVTEHRATLELLAAEAKSGG